MSHDMHDDDLERLLERLSLDGLNPEDCSALQAMLADNPEAQRRYVEAVHFREGLAYLLSHEAGNGPPAGAFTDQTATDAPMHSDAQGSEPASLRQRPMQASRSRLERLRQWLPSWAAAASVAFLVGAAAAILASRSVPRETAAVDSPRKVLPASSTPLLEENQLGKISGLSLEASADGLLRSMQVGQELRCGEVVQLPSGFVRVQLYAGPELLIEGPAEFSLIGEEIVFMRSGRLSAKGGQRLLLQTPLLSAECLDARLSLEADDDDSAAIYVAEGVVTLTTTPQERVESQKLQVLHSGEGLVAEPAGEQDSLRISARGPLAGVVDEWSQVEERLSDYQRLVLNDRPLAYWPLYKVRKNRRVLDLTQNGYDGLPIGNWPSEVDAKQTDSSGRGVYFNGECYIEPDRKPPVKMQSGFAIEGWAKPEGPAQYQAIFTSRWVVASHTPSQQCFGITLYAGDTDRWEFWTGRGRYGEFWNVMETPQTIDRTAWTHVVGVFTPKGNTTPGFLRGVAHMYVNGEQVLEAEHEVSLTDFDWPARIGAAEFVPRYLTSWLFKGYLTDIAVYGYPLEPARIKEHYESGKPSVGDETSSYLPGGDLLLATLGRSASP